MTVVQGDIDSTDITARLLFPTPERKAFLPFERFAESVATSRKKGELHAHTGQEVVTYVLEGYIDHEYGAGVHDNLTQGSVLLLTAPAPDEVRHALTMERGRTARWLSIVARLPPLAEPATPSLKIKTPASAPVGSDGTVRVPLIGPNGAVPSSSGLELTDIAFEKRGNAFVRLGRDRRGLAYALQGTGSIDDHELEPGHGALLEKMSAISVQGEAGYRIVYASLPRPAE
jgi:redox-sensitive bicupin YhaK (pirin superfamily)